MTFPVQVGPNWADQIEHIRNQISEDTNIGRFDNLYYRMCRDDPGLFQVALRPSFASAGLPLTIIARTSNLYVTEIGGQRFERYSSKVTNFEVSAQNLDNMIQSVGSQQGEDRFNTLSVIVFCVAESLRSDYIATAIGQTIRTTIGLQGRLPRLPLRELMTQARSWGQGSDAVYNSLSAQAQAIVLRRRASLSLAERQFSERVDQSNVEGRLQLAVRRIRLLKRPG